LAKGKWNKIAQARASLPSNPAKLLFLNELVILCRKERRKNLPFNNTFLFVLAPACNEVSEIISLHSPPFQNSGS
jgi:hypothetical protein